jgi:hypothetical protein
LSKKISIPRRPGRPRTNLEKEILAARLEEEKRLEEEIFPELGGYRWRTAYEAGCLRRILEKGTRFQKAACAPQIEKLRRTKWACANDPSGRLSDREFLDRFIEAHAPGFDWRQDALQGEKEDQEHERENERIAKENAEDARYRMAWANKFCTPDAPDGVLLCALVWEYRKQRFIRRTWPTLRELKLATAIPERTLKKTIKSLRPKKGEIIKLPLRHKFSRRGAMPLRYGPRLVVSVLDEFVNRLPEFPMDDEQRKRLRKTALLVKRAFAARMGHSRSST